METTADKIPKIIVKNLGDVPYINDEMDTFIFDELTIQNPVWIENHRTKRWNGDTPKELFFYKKENDQLLIPRGFIPALLAYCKEKNIQTEVDRQTNHFEKTGFVFHGKLKDFQIDATEDMLPKYEGTLCSPTGSGKTVMGLYLIAKRQQPTLIIVHTKELLYQWVERIKTFLHIPENKIGIVGDGKLYFKNITIALVQTLKKHLNVLDSFGYLVVDECHKVPSTTFTDIITAYSGDYINGLSATPYRNDGLGNLIKWYVGGILHKIKPKTLIASGDIVKVKPIIRQTFFKSQLNDPKEEYSKLLTEISEDEERNRMIVSDVISEAKNGAVCLVLSDRKNHCETLKQLIPSRYKPVILTGDVDSDTRKEIVKKVNNNEIKVLIVTGQLIGEGFDCKNLSTLFLTMPMSYAGRIFQYVGRVLRPKEGKGEALVYDYFDVSVKCLYGGFKSREKVYKELS
jgi:superfamily II DNA or RNA helicase